MLIHWIGPGNRGCVGGPRICTFVKEWHTWVHVDVPEDGMELGFTGVGLEPGVWKRVLC